MEQPRGYYKLTLVVFFFCCVNAAKKDIDLGAYCHPLGRTVDISDATAGDLAWDSYPPDQNCRVTLEAAVGKWIFLQFTDIAIKGTSAQFGCDDVLYVKQGNYGPGFPPDRTWETVCGRSYPNYYATSRYATFNLVSTPDGGGHIRIRYTVYYHPSSGSCNGFKCIAGDKCIDESLMCDGIDHCGEGSDESTDSDGGCGIVEYRKTVRTIGIAVGCVGGVILLVIVGVLVYRRHRQRSQ